MTHKDLRGPVLHGVAAGAGRFAQVPRLWTGAAVLIAIAGCVFAAMSLMMRFAVYDDEGYMLVSLKHYLNNEHLYTQTFSQYGPFYFYAQGFFFQLLRLPLTHDMGRLVTLIYWAASSLLASAFVYRLSRSILLMSAAGLSVMLAGKVLANEPGHPQQVILLLYTLAAYLSLPSRRGQGVRMFLLGCIGAALCLTKLNVGIFYLAGLTQAVVCLLAPGRFRSIGLGLTLLYAAAAPWLLMHTSFHHGFLGYCLLATLGGIVAFVCGGFIPVQQRLSMRAALLAGAGLLAGIASVVVATSWQGMRVEWLIAGVILNPLRQPNLFYFSLGIHRRFFLLAAVLTLLVIVLRVNERRMAGSRWFDGLACAAGVGSIVLLTLFYQIGLIVPLLSLTLIPRPQWKLDAGALFCRLFITYMAVTQFLEPYPVSGSQVGIAAIPMILWAFLYTTDGLEGLQTYPAKTAETSVRGLRWNALASSALVLLLTAVSILSAMPSAPRLLWAALKTRAWQPLQSALPPSTTLRGSTWLHLPREQAAAYESIAKDVSLNCDVLFTIPGMASFNFWSGVPTPNGWNLTAWMKGFDLRHQTEILNILKTNPRACAVVNHTLLQFWYDDDRSLSALPLAHYMLADMPKVSAFGDYEIHVQPNRPSPWRQEP